MRQTLKEGDSVQITPDGHRGVVVSTDEDRAIKRDGGVEAHWYLVTALG